MSALLAERSDNDGREPDTFCVLEDLKRFASDGFDVGLKIFNRAENARPIVCIDLDCCRCCRPG